MQSINYPETLTLMARLKLLHGSYLYAFLCSENIDAEHAWNDGPEEGKRWVLEGLNPSTAI